MSEGTSWVSFDETSYREVATARGVFRIGQLVAVRGYNPPLIGEILGIKRQTYGWPGRHDKTTVKVAWRSRTLETPIITAVDIEILDLVDVVTALGSLEEP